MTMIRGIRDRWYNEESYVDETITMTHALQVCVDGEVQDTEADDGEESEVT